MSVKKTRSHALSEKHPILSMILSIVFWAVILNAIVAVITVALAVVFSVNNNNVACVTVVLVSFLILFLFRKWFSPEYQGALNTELPLQEVLKLCVPMLVFTLFSIISTMISDFYLNPTLSSLLLALYAGVNEEVLFRAVSIPIGMRYMKQENRAIIACVIVSVIFGGIHAGNILAGATVMNGLQQVVSAGLIGFYLAALYICTGSIWPGILLHTVYDFTCFTFDSGLTNGVMTRPVSLTESIVSLVVSALLCAAGVWIIRKNGLEQINRLWDRKWSRTVPAVAEEKKEADA